MISEFSRIFDKKRRRGRKTEKRRARKEGERKKLKKKQKGWKKRSIHRR